MSKNGQKAAASKLVFELTAGKKIRGKDIKIGTTLAVGATCCGFTAGDLRKAIAAGQVKVVQPES